MKPLHKNNTANQLELSEFNQLVQTDTVAMSNFALESHSKAPRFIGEPEEIEELVANNWSNWQPGVGAKDGDVRLVQLPVDNFVTDIVKITAENRHLLRPRFESRREGELPVATLVFEDMEPVKAFEVFAVVYRADVLAKDSDRSTEAAWEIVAILANPETESGSVPMHPATMARNYFHQAGGTYREYSAEEWAAASLFWQNHARIAGSDQA